ncbi:MAG: hypothetical protein WED07_05035 [Candidatus Freyarchaeum deiterrae]
MKRSSFWLIPPKDLRQKCLEFIILEGYFNPKTFSELEYALHNQEYPHNALIRELCRNIRCPEICEKCQAKCTWKKFCEKIKNLHIERSPPCVRKAFKLGRFGIVITYFSLLGLLSNTIGEYPMIKCLDMKKQNLCQTDNLCKNIESGNLTEYYNIRLTKKITEEIKGHRSQILRK